MPRKKTEQKIWYADFETTLPNKNNRVFVYCWAMVCGEEILQGTTIDSFIETIENMPKKTIIYFHNLSGFDFEFIEYYLLEQDIEYEILDKKQRIYVVELFNVKLYDSTNLINKSLEEIGNTYCVKYKKSKIEHLAQEGHMASVEEIKYCINDCFVLQEGITTFKKELKKLFIENNMFVCASKIEEKITISAIAFLAFRELSDFDKLCPKTTKEEHRLFEKAYKGGYVYSNNSGIEKDIKRRDVNSLYPSVYRNNPMPIGKSIPCSDVDELQKYKFYIAHIRIKYELKPDGYAIIGSGFGIYGSINYKESSNNEWEEMVLCDIDIDLIEQNYNCEWELIKGYGFKTKNDMFVNYCDLFMDIKKNSTGVKKDVAKLILNSSYGVLGKNGKVEIRERYIENGVIKKAIVDIVIEEQMFVYLPMAIAITAGARKILIESALKIGKENMCYMDTDSMKFNGNVEDEKIINIDDNELGAWKNENKGKENYFKTIAPKKYISWDKETGILEITCAGFNKKSLETEMLHNCIVDEETAIEQMMAFNNGLELEVLQFKKVKGGKFGSYIKKKIK